jgi:molybdopterin molybdotransferase
VAFSVREASERILAAVTPLPPVAVPLRESLGLVLAEDVVSPIEHPPWDNSSMDGYAVRAADVAGAAKDAPCRSRCWKRYAPGSDRLGRRGLERQSGS